MELVNISNDGVDYVTSYEVDEVVYDHSLVHDVESQLEVRIEIVDLLLAFVV